MSNMAQYRNIDSLKIEFGCLNLNKTTLLLAHNQIKLTFYFRRIQILSSNLTLSVRRFIGFLSTRGGFAIARYPELQVCLLQINRDKF